MAFKPGGFIMMKKTRKDFLLRSMLFVPGHIEKFFQKGIKSYADAIILDMEDSVPKSKKKDARARVKRKLKNCKLNMPIFVRLNSADTGLLEKDLEAAACLNVDGFVVPKVKGAKDVVYVSDLLLDIEKKNKIRPGKFWILPLIETAEAVLNVLEIAKASERILALIFGHEDFLLDMQASHSDDMENLLVPRMMIAMAARATGCKPIDTPYLDIKNSDGCSKFVSESKSLGFSGMLVLHPLQINLANEGYSPSIREVEYAKKIIALNEEAKISNRSIAYSEGKFIAPPILKQAEATLKIHAKIIGMQKKVSKE